MNIKAITKVAFFDFDGTLIDTAEPNEGRKIWKEKTGEEFPYKGWWSKRETLDLNVFENKPYSDMVSIYNEESKNPNTYLVLCTGRITPLRPQVLAILNKYNFRFDDVILNGDSRFQDNHGNDTLAFKIRALGSYQSQFPNLKNIEIWDDRKEHNPTFVQWGKLQKIPVIVNHVKH